MRAFLGDEYVLCDRCGKPIRRRRAKLSEEGLAEDTLSEFEELCDECRDAEAKDVEQPVD
jgi:hypothetical protein